jgi:hypothetical protein
MKFCMLQAVGERSRWESVKSRWKKSVKVGEKSVKVGESRWKVGEKSVKSRWKSVKSRWKSVKVGEKSVKSRWKVGEKSVKSRWKVGERSGPNVSRRYDVQLLLTAVYAPKCATRALGQYLGIRFQPEQHSSELGWPTHSDKQTRHRCLGFRDIENERMFWSFFYIYFTHMCTHRYQRTSLQFTKTHKNLHPLDIRTHDLLFCWRRRWPLHHATRAIMGIKNINTWLLRGLWYFEVTINESINGLRPFI